MNLLEQKEVSIGGKLYILTAVPTDFGLEVQIELQSLLSNGLPPTADLIERVVCKGATLGSAPITKQTFNKHFARKYGVLMELFSEICKFNFEDEDSPNVESDTPGQ